MLPPNSSTASPPTSEQRPLPQARRARLSRAERRQQLIETALPIFASRGFEKASLEEIALEAGVSRPILYSHFGDKRGLFVAVIELEIERVHTAVRTAILQEGPPRQRLEQGLGAYFRYAQDHPDGHAVLTRDAPLTLSDPGLGDMLTELGDEISAVIRHVMRLEGAPDKAAPLFANALIGMGSYVGQWWLKNPEMTADEVTAYCTMLVWNGFEELLRRSKETGS